MKGVDGSWIWNKLQLWISNPLFVSKFLAFSLQRKIVFKVSQLSGIWLLGGELGSGQGRVITLYGVWRRSVYYFKGILWRLLGAKGAGKRKGSEGQG